MSSSNAKRREKKVHLTKRQRKKVRQQLWEAFGDKCCWCGEKMINPTGYIKNTANMATIEHYFAKTMGDPNNTMLLRLCHERCNK